MRLSARLAKLEKPAAEKSAVEDPRAKYLAEEQARLEAAWKVMRPTMSDEHARMVVEAYRAGMNQPGNPGWGTPAGWLLQRCLDAMTRRRDHWPDSEIAPEVALAMPPPVAEVYLRDPGALPLHDCEDCGYKLPHGYFESCPLCGGRIGWYAYYNRMKAGRRTRAA